jgi:hypothetical protein
MATELSFLLVVVLDFFMLIKPGRVTCSVCKRASKLTSTLNVLNRTVKPVYNGHLWDSQKVVVVQKWPLLNCWSLKITINIEKRGIGLVVVDSWSLFRGCC